MDFTRLRPRKKPFNDNKKEEEKRGEVKQPDPI